MLLHQIIEIELQSMCHLKCHINITRMPENPNSRVDTTHFLKVTYPFIVLFVHDHETVAGSPVNNIAHFITAGLRFVCRQGIREPVAPVSYTPLTLPANREGEIPGGRVIIKKKKKNTQPPRLDYVQLTGSTR